MKSLAPALEVRPGPFLHQGLSTRRVMLEVVVAIVPVLAFAIAHFGAVALLTCTSTTAGALVTERLTSRRHDGLGTLRDGSALITGLLLGLTLPPALPQWMSFLGGVVSIALGKAVFGGLGQNPFNPALVGRAFLQSAFPTALTTWTAPSAGLPPSTWALPFTRGDAVDAISAATPLGLSKFQHELTAAGPLLWGNTAGSLGETSAALLLGVGAWLALRRICDWRLLVSPLLSVAVLSALLHLVAPERCPPPLFMLASGGLLFAAVFMVTDPVTSPITSRGTWIFGAGVGALVVLIRVYGGLPEGVMYAVLLMNACVPLIDRSTQPRPFGGVARR